MLVEIARMRSRDSKFETKVFVMSSSNFRRSLSRCVSDLARGDSAEFSGRFGVREGRILASSDVQCRTNSLRKAKVVSCAFRFALTVFEKRSSACRIPNKALSPLSRLSTRLARFVRFRDNDDSTGVTEMRMQTAMSYVCQPMYCGYDLMSSRASVGTGIRRFKLSLCNQQIISFRRTPQPSELIG